MTLITRILYGHDPFEPHLALIRMQRDLIQDQCDEIRRLKLAHAREMQGLVAGWLLHTETPEIDMRPELAQLDEVLGHRVAALEEYVIT